MFFDSPGAAWMMTVGLSALPYDIRLMLVEMTYIIELAIASEMKRCLERLQVLADSLEASSGDRGMVQKKAMPAPIQEKDRQRIEEESKALAERFKKIMQPKAPTASTKSLGVSKRP
jgi:hypothetical protein